jgi:hypothetical protein
LKALPEPKKLEEQPSYKGELAMNESTNPLPSPVLVVGAMSIGAVLAPLIIPATGGFIIAHMIARRRQGRNS